MSRQDLQERLAQAGFRLDDSELVAWYGQDDEDEEAGEPGAEVSEEKKVYSKERICL